MSRTSAELAAELRLIAKRRMSAQATASLTEAADKVEALERENARLKEAGDETFKRINAALEQALTNSTLYATRWDRRKTDAWGNEVDEKAKEG
jgi:hypothetical protein